MGALPKHRRLHLVMPLNALLAVASISAGLLLLSCSPDQQQLQRGLQYYEDNQYEEALALWRDMGPREHTLSRANQARYAYLRGMTDYRLGFSREAQYWLSLALATDRLHPGGFEPPWEARLVRALRDLSRSSYSGVSPGSQNSVQVIEAPQLAP